VPVCFVGTNGFGTTSWSSYIVHEQCADGRDRLSDIRVAQPGWRGTAFPQEEPMKSKSVRLLILAILLSPSVASAQLPKPPVFSRDAPVEETLHAYPLGVITRQAAFSHHGPAHQEIQLPNGLEGWVYDVGGEPKAVDYTRLTGEKRTFMERPWEHELREYILVFDGRGIVIDVLYEEEGTHDGLTALQLQHRREVQRMRQQEDIPEA